ncbi:MAG: hypothetical protein A2V70_09625, partial [Planctomycetes bacterium RBG_13_63_9]
MGMARHRWAVEPLERRLLLDAGSLIISEFMAINNSTLPDENGDYSDWIEIHNPSTVPVDLDGLSLTDTQDDLAKWHFPAVTLDPGGYLVVFASGKDRSVAGSELHTNFKLAGDGEYLALVESDGTTVVHQYAPEYPAQSADVSYGVSPEPATFVSEGAELTYLVPADGSLETTWTTTGFDDSEWVGSPSGSPVLITEAGTGTIDFVEIQNISAYEIDTSGWFVVANDAHEVNLAHTTVWDLPDSMAPGEVLYQDDNGDDEGHWGDGIFWSTRGSGWVMIVDDLGEIADFVVWGYSTEQIDSINLDLIPEGFTGITVGEAWDGSSEPSATDSYSTLQRTGHADHDDATDWAFIRPASGRYQNTGLTVPFPGQGVPATTGIGFTVDPSDLDEAIHTDAQSEMHGVNASVYTRIRFLAQDPSALDAMTLRMKYNDGFVAYLGGQQIASRNAPASPQWDSAALIPRSVEDSLVFEEIDVTDYLGALQPGDNVLAIQGMNVDDADDNFLILPELSAVDDQGSVWYLPSPTPGQSNSTDLIVINEIHYDPDVKTEPVEFVELYNPTATGIDLSGWQFTDGIEYTLPPDTIIPGNGYVVVAENPAAVAAKFGVVALGPFTGSLANEGEDLVLVNAAGLKRDHVDYSLGFPWPTVGDPPGHSIELVNPLRQNDLGGNWRSSIGSPTPGARNSALANNVAPQMRKVDHTPKQPNSGVDVTITVKVTDPQGVQSVTLAYQLVEPGDYISIDDPRYENPSYWASVPMVDDGTGADEEAGDDVYTAVLPGPLQIHRRLVRYRITAEDTLGASVTGPYADDPQPNFAYYVYDAVPSWTGSARPGVEPEVVYSSELLESVPVYQLITTRKNHEDSQHIPYSSASAYGGSDYLWEGTLVYDGEVYDHIRFRARGGVWRYSMGKNMWKFDFNRGHYFQARDDYGRPYDTTWDKLNFSAIIQQGDYLHRGEQGLFEAVAFKLFNLAGVESPYTHYVHFRIVESADEDGPNQFSGDFQGLYLVVEQPDGRMLDEHGLPDGNFYKMEDGTGTLNNQGPTQPTDKSDLNAFMSTYAGWPTEQWWRDNFELEKYYSYRSIVEGIHHYDIAYGKNYFYYHNPDNGKWSIHPWDVDLTWANNMYGDGNHVFKTKVADRTEFRTEYRNRMREIRVLLYNPEQTGMLIDEMASFIYTPGEPSLVDADRAMWDYSPILVNWSYVNSSKAGHGRFYEKSATDDFVGMTQLMKDYVVSRGAWIDSNILTDNGLVPDTPTISDVGDPAHPVNQLTFQTSAFASTHGSFAAIQWRVAPVTDPDSPDFDPAAPRKYEISAAWQSDPITTFNDTFTIPGGNLQAGETYRVRVRMQDDQGRWSHWSSPVQLVAGPPVGPVVEALRVTEVMYNPRERTAGEIAAGVLDKEDFEYIELVNTSESALNVEGVH